VLAALVPGLAQGLGRGLAQALDQVQVLEWHRELLAIWMSLSWMLEKPRPQHHTPSS